MKNIIISFLSLIPAFSFSQGNVIPEKVTDKLFSVELTGCNAAFLITDSGVVVVDAGISPYDGWLLKSAIATKTNKTVRYVIVTHHHFDHVGGLQVFKPEAKIIAQAEMFQNIDKCGIVLSEGFVEEMEIDFKKYNEKKTIIVNEFISSGEKLKADSTRAKILWYRSYIDSAKAVKKIKPDISFEKKYEFTFGGEKILLKHPLPSHTGADCIVSFVNEKACHVGDLYFEGSFPFIDSCSGAKINNWISVLDEFSKDKSVAYWLCGHGKIKGRSDFLIMKQLLIDMRNEVKSAVSKGLSLDQTIMELKMEKYKNYPGRDLLEKNIRVLYFELKKQK